MCVDTEGPSGSFTRTVSTALPMLSGAFVVGVPQFATGAAMALRRLSPMGQLGSSGSWSGPSLASGA